MRTIVSRVVTDVTLVVTDEATDEQIDEAFQQFENLAATTKLLSGDAEVLRLKIRERLTTSDTMQEPS